MHELILMTHQVWPGDDGSGGGGDNEPAGGQDPGDQGPGQEIYSPIVSWQA